MDNFIEVTDSNGWKRLVNTTHITDIVGSRIYLDCVTDDSQLSIDCKESYDQIRRINWR